jgi:hypothetical protein
MGNVAEAEAVESVEGNTCGLAMQEASSRRRRGRHHARKDRVGRIRQPIDLYSPNGDQPRGVRIDKRPSAISTGNPRARQLVLADRDHRYPTPPRQAPRRLSSETSRGSFDLARSMAVIHKFREGISQGLCH